VRPRAARPRAARPRARRRRFRRRAPAGAVESGPAAGAQRLWPGTHPRVAPTKHARRQEGWPRTHVTQHARTEVRACAECTQHAPRRTPAHARPVLVHIKLPTLPAPLASRPCNPPRYQTRQPLLCVPMGSRTAKSAAAKTSRDIEGETMCAESALSGLSVCRPAACSRFRRVAPAVCP